MEVNEENNNLLETASTSEYFSDISKRRRTVQLSSIRTIEQPIDESLIHPYGERLVKTKGNANVHLKKHSRWDFYSRYTKDIFTTLLDLNWFWVIVLTVVVYLGHWVIFGLIYWGFALSNDDYEKIWKSFSMNETKVTEEPCMAQVYDYMSAFLFSMESETTIGYGYRGMNTVCPLAVACLTVQCVVSAVFDTWVIGLCFMRLARPDTRRNTTLFAKHAVICKRDGKKCLIVRIANLRKSLLLGVSIRAHLITLRDPGEEDLKQGYQLVLQQHEIAFNNASSTMLTAPMDYCHIIDDDSPLKDIPLHKLNSSQDWFELVVVMSGTIEATSIIMHAQVSYLSSEIKCGYRFVQVIQKSPTDGKYLVDFKRFHDTIPEPRKIKSSNSACDRRSRRKRSEERRKSSSALSDVFSDSKHEKYQPKFQNHHT